MTIDSRALRGVASAGIVVLIAAGCGSVTKSSPEPSAVTPVAGAVTHPGGPMPGLRYRYGGTATFTAAPAPASTALPGANDVVSAGGTALLAAADSGIWRSADSGATWRRVLPSIAAWSVVAVPGGGYAALGVTPWPQGQGITQASKPELATSADGVSWHVATVPSPSAQWVFGYGYRLALSGTGNGGAGVAVPDAGMFGAGFAAPAFRTTDGGRHWIPLPLNGEGGLAMLANGRTIFATAPGQGDRCRGAVYESRDGGVTWALLPGSCQSYPLQAVQFTSDRDGFAAGGLTPKFGGGQVVEATTDGGLTWHVLYHVGTLPGGSTTAGFLRIDMVGGAQGWAVAGGCTTGQNGPCGGAVYVTADGGTQWRLTGQQALSVAGLGAGVAVAVDRGIGAATSDGGQTWTEQTRPETTQTQAFAGSGGYQLWLTSLAGAVSADSGQRWSQLPAFPAPLATQVPDLGWQAAPPSALLGYAGSGSQVWASGDGGRTWAASTVPGGDASPLATAALGGGGTAYAVSGPDAQCLSAGQVNKVQKLKPGWKPPSGASVLYASTDGGARWSASGLVLPFGVQYFAAMAASGSRIALIDACGRLELSSDAGAHWTAQALGSGPSCTVSVLGSQLWLDCQNVGQTSALGNIGATWSLHSADGGATWVAYQLPALAGAGPGSYAPGSYATGDGSAVMPVGGALWRTSDGGKSWAESWVLPR
jgi:photosystem II stability/assembly factor-like uncharacterized protein